MKFQDVPIGQRVVLIEKVGEPNGDCEIRHTHYERAEGVARYFPKRNVPAFRLRMTQGILGEKPRYDGGELRIATETHKLLPVELWEGGPPSWDDAEDQIAADENVSVSDWSGHVMITAPEKRTADEQVIIVTYEDARRVCDDIGRLLDEKSEA
jgi:hypothetical protein